jgi:hypothetical protein
MGRFRGCEPEPHTHKIQLVCPGLELDQGVLLHTPLISRYQLEKVWQHEEGSRRLFDAAKRNSIHKSLMTESE